MRYQIKKKFIYYSNEHSLLLLKLKIYVEFITFDSKEVEKNMTKTEAKLFLGRGQSPSRSPYLHDSFKTLWFV